MSSPHQYYEQYYKFITKQLHWSGSEMLAVASRGIHENLK
jgi:hypothetical protein